MTTHPEDSSSCLCGRPKSDIAKNEHRADPCLDALPPDGALVSDVPECLQDLVPDQIAHVLGDVIDADRAVLKKVSGGRSSVHARDQVDLQCLLQGQPCIARGYASKSVGWRGSWRRWFTRPSVRRCRRNVDRGPMLLAPAAEHGQRHGVSVRLPNVELSGVRLRVSAAAQG